MLQSPLAQRRAAKQNATTYQFVNLFLPPRSPLNSSKKSPQTVETHPFPCLAYLQLSVWQEAMQSPSRETPHLPSDNLNTRNNAIYQA